MIARDVRREPRTQSKPAAHSDLEQEISRLLALTEPSDVRITIRTMMQEMSELEQHDRVVLVSRPACNAES